MKRIREVLIVMTLFCLLSSNAISQDNEEHYYTVTIWKIDIPQDGSRSEFNELQKEWYNKITVKNDKILSQRIMHHIWGSDQRDVVIITEYASWSDIRAAQEKQEKLVRAAWPNEEARQAYFKKLGKYSLTHSDEIYLEYPALRK